jgi:hypothetical protein
MQCDIHKAVTFVTAGVYSAGEVQQDTKVAKNALCGKWSENTFRHSEIEDAFCVFAVSSLREHFSFLAYAL